MKRGWLKYIVVALLVAASPPAAGVERSQDFLEALRERGLFDVAMEYLEQMKTSPLASDEFKANILFEQGATLVDWARHTGDMKTRESTASGFSSRSRPLGKASRRPANWKARASIAI